MSITTGLRAGGSPPRDCTAQARAKLSFTQILPRETIGPHRITANYLKKGYWFSSYSSSQAIWIASSFPSVDFIGSSAKSGNSVIHW